MKNFLKIAFALSALTLLAMVYWSSYLLESDVKKIRGDLRELKAQTANLGQKIRRVSQQSTVSKIEQTVVNRPHIHPFIPNLLDEDTYYSETLPSQLGDDFNPKGVLRYAMVGRPENLHPFNGFRDVSQMIEMCSVRVANLQFGKYETQTPDMAIKLEKRRCLDEPDRKEYWVHLRDDVTWQPLKQEHFPDNLELAPHFFESHPVTAHDFKFFYDAIMNPYVSDSRAASLRSYFQDIDEFRVIDDHTFAIRWKRYVARDPNGMTTTQIKYTSLGLTCALQPLPSFVYQYFADGQKIVEDDSDPETYRTNSVWAQNFSQHWSKNVIVSCGRYLFDGMTDEGVNFRRNPDHYNPHAVLVAGVQYRFKENLDNLWQDFKVGNIDMCTLSPNQAVELDNFLKSDQYAIQEEKGAAIEQLDYTDMSYYYVGWNQQTPYFASPKVRQAMTMAIDRDRIVEQNLNSRAEAISGPFFCQSESNNSSIDPWPYNPERARRLLDEEGWIDVNGDGIRDKLVDGKTISFRFKLYYFVKSSTTKAIVDYMVTALRDIGVECQLCGLDLADLSRQFEDKNFDAICMGWKLGTPPEDPRQLWHSKGAKEKGSSNAIGFSNPQIDKIIEALNYEYDKPARISLYHQFHAIIHKEAPYTFLYTPKVRLVYREYVKNLFIPLERQDLVSGANIAEPNTQVIWLDKTSLNH